MAPKKGGKMKIEEKTVELIEKIEQLLVQQSEQTYTLVLDAIFANAASKIIIGFILSFFAAVCFFKIKKHFKTSCRTDLDTTTEEVFCALYSVVFLVSTIIALAYLLSVNNWIAIFSPETALIHKIIN